MNCWGLNLTESEELVSISPSAFIDMILHVFRFWSSEPAGERKVVYGLLLGFLEGNTRHVKKVVPLNHHDKPNFVMDEDFMREVGKVNQFELESQSMNEVIGWYRSSNDGIKFIARDIKNHIQFQGFNPLFIGLVIDPKLYVDPDAGGFSVFRLQGESYYNMMSDYYKIPWEIQTIENVPNILTHFQQFIRSYFLDKPLITELNE